MEAQRGMIMSKWALCVLGLVISAHLVSVAHSVFECPDLLIKLSPCQKYVLGGEPNPSDECCASFRDLDSMTTKHEDRVALCECVKQGAALIHIDFNKVNQMPKLCNVPLNLTFSPNMDCSKV